MVALSNKIKETPAYDEYHTFLKKVDPAHSFAKDYTAYLSHNTLFKNLLHTLPGALYLLDFESSRYLFVSKSCETLTGYPAEQFMENGRRLFLENVHPADLKIFSGVAFAKFIHFTQQVTAEELKKHRFSINYRFKRKDGVYIKILQQYHILEVNSQGYPLLSQGFVSDITGYKTDDTVLFSIASYHEESGYTLLSTDTYPRAIFSFSKREQQIIKYIVQGLSSKQIATKLYLSTHTINAHRQNISKKTNCKNAAELSHYAQLNGLH